MKNLKLLMACLTFTPFLGCQDRPLPPPPPPATATPLSISNSSPRRDTRPEPTDHRYKIIKTDAHSNIKRSLTIELSNKVSATELREIAIKLKNSSHESYERTFILYYLPGMTVGSGAWATTHFNPDLKVQILGPTIEEENLMRNASSNAARIIIGQWLDQRPGMGGITIFKESEKTYIESRYKDGSFSIQQAKESRSPIGRRFDKLEQFPTDDHFIIDVDGNLQILNDEGLILTINK